jgi:hypothetical protein
MTRPPQQIFLQRVALLTKIRTKANQRTSNCEQIYALKTISNVKETKKWMTGPTQQIFLWQVTLLTKIRKKPKPRLGFWGEMQGAF